MLLEVIQQDEHCGYKYVEVKGRGVDVEECSLILAIDMRRQFFCKDEANSQNCFSADHPMKDWFAALFYSRFILFVASWVYMYTCMELNETRHHLTT